MNYSIKTVIVFFGSILIIGAMGALVANYIGNNSKEHILEQQQKYCYDTSRNVINPAFFIKSLTFKDELIDYYRTVSENPKATPVLQFPITTLPQRTPVYVLEYTEDGLLAEIICYYDRGPSYASKSIKGWVYYRTLHDLPPKREVK